MKSFHLIVVLNIESIQMLSRLQISLFKPQQSCFICPTSHIEIEMYLYKSDYTELDF